MKAHGTARVRERYPTSRLKNRRPKIFCSKKLRDETDHVLTRSCYVTLTVKRLQSNLVFAPTSHHA